MGVVYDELFISTMKEISVCKKAIKKLSKTLNDMELKHNMATAEFIVRLREGKMRDETDYAKWHDSFVGLNSWEERLREFEEILRSAEKMCE